jgi:hypothetical protein
MHISEGVLSAPVLISGGVLAAVGTAIGLKKIDYDQLARVGILSASFFVASLVHVPIGPSSVHLIMNGIVGLLLGWAAVPAILVALLLQAVFFQFGGITTLGVNTIIMALPAVLCSYLFAPLLRKDRNFLSAGRLWLRFLRRTVRSPSRGPCPGVHGGKFPGGGRPGRHRSYTGHDHRGYRYRFLRRISQEGTAGHAAMIFSIPKKS